MKNVVLLTIDTLRKDVLGCYGNQDGLTPFIDSIAERCLKFTNNHSIAPYTQASFPGLLTSSYVFDYPRAPRLSGKRTLISEALKKAGIQTAGFHSNPYLSDYFGWNRGWDHFYDSMEDEVEDLCPYIAGNIVNEKADAWLASHADKPFFLWTHYMDVHEPYAPERKYIDRVDPSIQVDRTELMRLFKDVVLKRDASDPATNELLYKLYRAHVIQVDEYTKMLFDVLAGHNVLDDTVVIITTDHGDEFNDHGSLSHDGKMYSELVNVPLLVYNSQAAGTGVCDKLVSGLDIPPTIVDLFGLERVENFQGQSFLSTEDYPDKPCFGEAMGKLAHKIKETDRPAYFCRRKNLKIIHREEEGSWEMYDLEADPKEQTNIVDTCTQAEEMKQELQPRIGRRTLDA